MYLLRAAAVAGDAVEEGPVDARDVVDQRGELEPSTAGAAAAAAASLPGRMADGGCCCCGCSASAPIWDGPVELTGLLPLALSSSGGGGGNGRRRRGGDGGGAGPVSGLGSRWGDCKPPRGGLVRRRFIGGGQRGQSSSALFITALAWISRHYAR